MKELFSQAVQKMKRKDFLDDFIREKTAEEAKITAEAAILRKKNGWQVGSELDLQIFQINRRKADIQKLVSKCKAEIKVLKAEISELLVRCYVLADKPELREKVNSAFYHAFEGKSKLVSDEDVGGVFGDCEIVGAIITHDKKKKNKTASLERAGIVNSLGKITLRPQIVVYDYDKKQEEGVYRKEDDSFKTRTKPTKERPTLDYIKDVYKLKTVILALLIVAVYSAFAVFTSVKDIDYVFSETVCVYTGILAFCLFGHTFATVKKGKRGGVSDILPLSAILTAVVSVVTHFGAYDDIIKELVFPVVLFCYGVFSVILRKKLNKNSQNTDENGVNTDNGVSSENGANFVVSIAIGGLLAFLIKEFNIKGLLINSIDGVYMKNFSEAVFFAVCLSGWISAICCIVKRGTETAYGFSYFITLTCAFLVTVILLGASDIQSIIYGLDCIALGICGLIGLKRKGEKNV